MTQDPAYLKVRQPPHQEFVHILHSDDFMPQVIKVQDVYIPKISLIVVKEM